MKIIDIGCGRKKIPGSIGIDFSDYAEVDIKLDLNTSDLPFDDDSVDFVHSSHCLEHLSLDGFLNMIRESYRVCKPEGTIFVAVPYFHTGANFANPFHNNKVCFNEHTFRFFSSETTCPALEAKDYASRSCPQWGLRYSANEELGVELRLNKVELMYFSEYESEADDLKSMLRRTQSNIVENIHYWLQPIKPAPKMFDQAELKPTVASEVVQFIDDQAKFLEEQMTYLAAHTDATISSNFATAGLRGKNISDFLSDLALAEINVADQEHALFSVDGHLSPYYEAIRIYDDKIQFLRSIIDDITSA